MRNPSDQYRYEHYDPRHGMPRYTIPRTAHCDTGALTMLTQELLWQTFMQPPRPWPPHPSAGPWCGCCLHIIRAGDDHPRRVTTAYVWTHKDSRETPLCVSCCARWRENAAMDPDLLPARIRTA